MSSATQERMKRAEIGGSESQYLDWAMTVLFYVALHEIQAFLVSKKSVLASKRVGIPGIHLERREVLRKHWKKLGEMYEQFFDWTNQARYDCIMPVAQDLEDAEELLRRIRAQIESYK